MLTPREGCPHYVERFYFPIIPSDLLMALPCPVVLVMGPVDAPPCVLAGDGAPSPVVLVMPMMVPPPSPLRSWWWCAGDGPPLPPVVLVVVALMMAPPPPLWVVVVLVMVLVAIWERK